jgi:predicted regulator of Ras-like GTPase activity (Roadblock/LC7/MglB family)
MTEPDDGPVTVLRRELFLFRERVAGARGSVLAGVDGLMHFQEGTTGLDPHDLAALAAATYGIGRQTGHVMNHGRHHESTIHNAGGYLVVYSINDSALLAMVCEAGTNIARLHLEYRNCVDGINQAVRNSMEPLTAHRPRL